MISFILKSPQNLVKFAPKLTKQRHLYYFSTSKQSGNNDGNLNVLASNLGVKDKASKDDDYQEIALKFDRDWKKHYEERNEAYALHLISFHTN